MYCLEQWFLTGGTRTPWGCEAPNCFWDTRPENKKNVFSIVVSAVNFIRGQALNHRLFEVFF